MPYTSKQKEYIVRANKRWNFKSGAVRSGKTFALSLSFVIWATFSFDGALLGFCGKTITALRRNVILPLLPCLKELGFETVIDPAIESGLVVSVKYPNDPNWSFEKVHDYCYERGFTIYPGKISTTNTFRLCALGTIDVKDIEDFFVVLKEALNYYKVDL